MRRRRVPVLAAAALTAAVASWAGALNSASAAVNYSLKVGNPDMVHMDQRVSVAISQAKGAVLYVTYRQVSTTHPPSADAACAPNMATNVDPRLVGPVVVKGTVRASVVLPLRPYAYCDYVAPQGSLDPAQAKLANNNVIGQYPPGAGLTSSKATKVTVARTGGAGKETVKGTTTGTSGWLVVQAKVAGAWRAVRSLPVAHHHYAGQVTVAAGQQLRVYLLPTNGWRASATKAFVAR